MNYGSNQIRQSDKDSSHIDFNSKEISGRGIQSEEALRLRPEPELPLISSPVSMISSFSSNLQ